MVSKVCDLPDGPTHAFKKAEAVFFSQRKVEFSFWYCEIDSRRRGKITYFKMPDNTLRRCSLELHWEKKNNKKHKERISAPGWAGCCLRHPDWRWGMCILGGCSAKEALTPRSVSPCRVFLERALAGAFAGSQSTIPNWYWNIRGCWSPPLLPSCEKLQSPCCFAEMRAARIFLPYGLLNCCSIKLPSFIKWLAERTNAPC